MGTNSTITKTHVNRLINISIALRMRQKMDANATQLILSHTNQKAMDEAAELIGKAIAILNTVK